MDKFKAPTSGRLDKVLATELDVSRNQVEKLVKDGLVNVNDKTIIKSSFKVSEGDVLLLCSDGVTKELHDDEIKAALEMRDPELVVARLISTALERGGRDNITAVCVQVRAFADHGGDDITRRISL